MTALDEELEPPTTHEESIQHEGKTLQQMIDEGTGSSQQNPIDIDQFDNGPGLSQYNLIDIDHGRSNPSHGEQVILKSEILGTLVRG